MKFEISREEVLSALSSANDGSSGKLTATNTSCETCERVLHHLLDEAIIAALASVTATGAGWFFELPKWFTSLLTGILAIGLNDLQKLFEVEIPEPTADAIIKGLCSQFCA